MHPTRIAELLEPFLGSQAEDRRPKTEDLLYQDISTYIDLLFRWNARINLTAIRNEEEIVTRHFGESLFAARHLFPRVSPVLSVSSVVKGFDFSANDQRPTTDDNNSLADLGSGAGFPGIPIKLWAPHVALTLIESNQKKVAFLREAARALTLTNIDIFPDRAELLAEGLAPTRNQLPGEPTHPRRFHVVTLRAVERFTDALPTATRLLTPHGRLALLIGSAQRGLVLSTLPNLTWQQALPIPLSTARILLIGSPSNEPSR